MKAEEFVKTFTKEEILDALFHKSRLSERAARNLCAALDREYKAMKKNLKTAGYNGSLGIRGVRREAEA